jgi:hypothetical protein
VARDFNGSNHYLSWADNVVTTETHSLVMWFNPGSISGTQVTWCQADSASDRVIAFVNSSGTVTAKRTDGGSEGGAVTTVNTASAGVWSHLFWRSTSGDHIAILDGDTGNAGTSAGTTNLSPSGTVRSAVGCQSLNGTQNAFYEGLVSWVVIWDVALSDGEGLEMAAGRHPRSVRPADIVSCVPIWGEHSPEIDLIGGHDWVVNNSVVAVVDQPPMGLWTPGRKPTFQPEADGAPPVTDVVQDPVGIGIVAFAR